MLVSPGGGSTPARASSWARRRWPQPGWWRRSSHRRASTCGGHLVRAGVGAVGAVGQGLQPAGPIAAQPAVDRLAADPVAVGDLGHREPVPDDFHDGVEALLCHCELQEHAPDLLTSPLVGEAQEGQAVVSTINRNSGTHQPVSTRQASTGSAHHGVRDGLPAICQQQSLTTPQAAPCRFNANRAPSRADRRQPVETYWGTSGWLVNGMQGVRGSDLLSSTSHNAAGHSSRGPRW